MTAPSAPFVPRALRGDRALPVLAGLGMTLETILVFLRNGGHPGAAAAGWLLALASCAALAARRAHPVAAGCATLLIAAAYFPVSPSDGLMAVSAYAVALYSLAREERLRAALTLAGAGLIALVWTEIVVYDGERERHVDPTSVLLLGGWFLGVIAFGHAMQVRQAYQREAEQRALAAERERDARARSAATEERLRIARELHDVLGHSISLITVQASAALHRSAKRPGRTDELVQALTFARDTSKEALRELRATLGVLRQVDDSVGETSPTAPMPGVERLDDLAERARAAGLAVTTETTGEPAPLPPQISLAAYRIVQESLTNVTRHARGATRAAVRLAYEPGELRVTVEDDGDAACPDTDPGAGPEPVGDGAEGSGIRGMRERARALGGELTAGAGARGFRVAARLPLDRRPLRDEARPAQPAR